ncbi:MAG: pyruvate kinase, partial [Deltaproteobacteria bacterium]|nr:pyruvate kinase [Deltaproteobacteria bacterium]
MRRTKIICTVGPASRSPEMLRRLIEAGVDLFRLNFSHGTVAEHRATIHRIRAISKELEKSVAILQDLPGPKIRIGSFRNGSIRLHAGDRFILTAEEVPGDRERASVNYPRLPEEVRSGQTILLADGTVELQVESVAPPDIICRVIVGGALSEHKGVTVPRGGLSL